jgi:hypothetical protein
MNWLPATDGDDRARALYLRHYSSKKNRPWWKRSRQFLKPGGKMLLLTVDCRAVFAWVRQEHRDDGQEGVECTIFRNEGPQLSSALIREADELAWERWPGERHFTYVDPTEIRSNNPGACFLRAGWTRLAEPTQRGLRVLERTT